MTQSATDQYETLVASGPEHPDSERVSGRKGPCSLLETETSLQRQTPMMQQYWSVRETLPKETLLLFRLGDFYELFEDQAHQGAQLLGLSLTARQGVPMAGLPVKASESYIAQLLKIGKQVAICEQISGSEDGKLFKRGVTRILSPGTHLESELAQPLCKPRYLLALNLGPRDTLSISWMDINTGEFFVMQAEKIADFCSIFQVLDPVEILLPDGFEDSQMKNAMTFFREKDWTVLIQKKLLSYLPGARFSPAEGSERVRKTLNVLSLASFGVPDDLPALGPAGALLEYASTHLCAQVGNLKKLQLYQPEGVLAIDAATFRNLEVFENFSGQAQGSLLSAMDSTLTAAGARLLRSYLAFPSRDFSQIKWRQQCVGELIVNVQSLENLREHLSGVRDIKRALGRLQNRLCSPRDLGVVRDTLMQLPALRHHLHEIAGCGLKVLLGGLSELAPLRDQLQNALKSDLPMQVNEGGIFEDTYDAQLQQFRQNSSESKSWVSRIEAQEQAQTGIKNLRIKYHSGFGYFIEVTKSNLGRVPAHYVRKQTMTNAERYITPELKEKEQWILQADQQALHREAELFDLLVQDVLAYASDLDELAEVLAQLDVFSSWALIAKKWGYVCPQWNDQGDLQIEEGRHPVVEQQCLDVDPGMRFVPNDCTLNPAADQVILITGPNMAGKSTYIRQVALIALMAHVGAWVPAKSCSMFILDRIFSRLGASDALYRGQSTFMVEMVETAHILHGATPKSLVVLDEVGRGTSTYDGLSIAWAVVEYLHGKGIEGPCTLFATHYHELTNLSKRLPRLKNFSVAVKENQGEIVFLRKVIEGAADRSYGIHVARLAGLPTPVLERAQEVLGHLQESAGHSRARPLSLKEDPREQLKFL